MPLSKPPRYKPRFKASEKVYAKVLGGPCGGMYRGRLLYPKNPKRRQWKGEQIVWRFEAVETMNLWIQCGGQWYRREEEDGRWYYVHQLTPAVRPRIVAAIGGSPFWRRVLGDLCQ